MDIEVVESDDAVPDVLIGCLGYEHRSIEILRRFPDRASCRLVFFDYCSSRLHSYDSNVMEVENLSMARKSVPSEFLESIRDAVGSGTSLVEIDVTSFDRHLLARTLQEIFSLGAIVKKVRIAYFPRVYKDPSDQLENVVSFGPISSAFIGEASFSRENLSLIVGAGFEYGRIVGAMDMLEPERTYCLFPKSSDGRFEAAIFRNNLDFSFLENKDLLQPYFLERPDSLYFELRRLVEFELRERNVLLLPLGPKLFAAISLVVAILLHPAVMVWRHSTVSVLSPSSTDDALASGQNHSFTFRVIH